MADEQKTDATVTETEQRLFSQDEVNKILQDRLGREKAKQSELSEKASKYDELSQRLAEEEKQKLVEQQKYQELAQKFESEVERLKPFESKWIDWEKAERERIQQATDGLSDAQRDLVAALPLPKQMAAIQEFTRENAKPGISSTKGGKVQGMPTLAELDELKAKHGVDSSVWREAYAKYRTMKNYK